MTEFRNPFAAPPPGDLPPGWTSTPTFGSGAATFGGGAADGSDWAVPRDPDPLAELAERRTRRRRNSPLDRLANARSEQAKAAIAALDGVAADEARATGEVLATLQHTADTDSARIRAARELVRIIQSEIYLKAGAWARDLVDKAPRIALAELGRRLADGDISIGGAEALRKIIESRAALGEVEALENRIRAIQKLLDQFASRMGN